MREMNKVDLHVHSLCSDGTKSPRDVVRSAHANGLAGIALTDHDTVAGIDEAIAEGSKLQLQIIPGVEISTMDKEQDIHVLGYYINYEDEVFLSRLEQLRKTRDLRNEMLISRLQKVGVQITMEDVMQSLQRPLADNETIGRPHIADAMVKKGYVQSLAEAFELYLGRRGKAYVNPPRISPMEAILWIHEAGGTAVLAHPGLYGDDELIEQLIRAGLDGIEAYHSDHQPEDEQRYRQLAERHGLLITAGSDYHGERQGRVFHGPLGNRTVDLSIIEQLQRRR